MSRAASAISSIGEPPSDQSECVWQSPRRAARMAAVDSSSGASSVASSLRRYTGTSPLERLAHAPGRHVPDTGEFGQRARGRALSQLGIGQRVDRLRRGAERPYAIRGLTGTLEQEGNPAQVGDRISRGHPLTVGGAWQAAVVRPGLQDETIRRIEQAAGRLATQSVARMDEQLPWFRELPADQRSWVTLVAQAGLQSYVDWLRSPDDVLRLTGEVFAAAPQAMARSVNLQQTVELVRQTIAVAEENLPTLAAEHDADIVREELLRFSREIAFAAARVYALAAETRGAWDERLEALIIDNLVRGGDVGDPLPSQLAALGWQVSGPIGAVVGAAPDRPTAETLSEVHNTTQRMGLDAMAGVHGPRLVIVFSGAADPLDAARGLLSVFADGPVVVGPAAKDAADASAITRAALSGLRAAPAWPGAPRPVSADALLPERALADDTDARRDLIESVYQPLVKSGGVLVETVTAFLESGGALESTARVLFVHANTVRYRLRRVAEICGESPTDPRGAFTLRTALALGRLASIS